MILVGITGAIGHGKSTLADMLIQADPVAVHLESFYIIAEVVDGLHDATVTVPTPDVAALNQWLKPLPDILQRVTGQKYSFKQIKLDPEHITDHPVLYEKLFAHIKLLQKRPELIKHHINQENKTTYRPMLQWVGGYLPKKLDPGIWYGELVRRADAAGQQGAKLCVIGGVRYPIDADVIRDAGGKVIKIYRPGMKQAHLSDPTERERDNIQVDSTMINDGSLRDLSKNAEKLLADLRANRLKPRYN